MKPMVQVLRQLPPMIHPDLLAGAERFDDAGVYRVGEGLAIVLTTDFFPPLVDDPYTFGQIAAANSLSDVYAMGGEPIVALNIVAFPDNTLDMSILADILRGGADKVLEAGAVIAGGHSVRDAEIKYGLAVTGRIDPDRIVRNAGAQPGDVLALTKPIGSGVLTTAAKKELITEADLAEAIAVMTALNRPARDAMLAADVHAATDITGFGLLGHAFEMADAGDVTLSIDAAAVPLMARTLDFARQGLVTRAHKSTLEHLGDRLEISGVDELLVKVLADAQTSGGLLVSIPADKADTFLNEYARLAGTPWAAAVIGRVEPRGAAAIQLH